MQQRLSLITLGAKDLERARAFYEKLGWTPHPSSGEGVFFFQLSGMVFALWDRSLLAEDSGVTDGNWFGGITLAHNVGSPAEVDQVLKEAAAAGAKITRAPDKTFWGGYSGVFLDLDGYPWEIAHNPGWQLDSEGRVQL